MYTLSASVRTLCAILREDALRNGKRRVYTIVEVKIMIRSRTKDVREMIDKDLGVNQRMILRVDLNRVDE